MNRAARREAERLTRRMQRTAAADPNAVELLGGPMDHWVVKPDAPALQPDWRPDYLWEEAKAAFEETRRAGQAQGVPLDELPPPWEKLDQERRNYYYRLVAAAKGDGRYVRRPGTRFADWRPAE